jgi:hypothetical protein
LADVCELLYSMGPLLRNKLFVHPASWLMSVSSGKARVHDCTNVLKSGLARTIDLHQL